MAIEPAQPIVGRFAPSPTGRMHAGNIFSALMCWLAVRLQGGRIVLRIEDLDRSRCRREHVDRIMTDLEMLGLTWDDGPFFQSTRSERYREALSELDRRGLLYPCFCTRADLRAASAPHEGETSIYPGTCRDLTQASRAQRLTERRRAFADPAAAAAYEPAMRMRCDERIIEVDDLFQGAYSRRLDACCGDFTVQRSDGGASYQLAVVVDDAEQGVNCVVRGYDLLASVPQQAYLQRTLGYPTPTYGHVPLLVDAKGVRLAKRHESASLDKMLARYRTPEGVLGRICAATGLIEEEEPVAADEVLMRSTLPGLMERFSGVERIAFTG